MLYVHICIYSWCPFLYIYIYMNYINTQYVVNLYVYVFIHCCSFLHIHVVSFKVAFCWFVVCCMCACASITSKTRSFPKCIHIASFALNRRYNFMEEKYYFGLASYSLRVGEVREGNPCGGSNSDSTYIAHGQSH